jgi:hypothetical protein
LRRKGLLIVLTLALAVSAIQTGTPRAEFNPGPPASPVRLVFIHHSTGENWLADDYGGLGIALRDNQYFVSDTNYGWGPDSIGDLTDIGHWWTWFRGANSATYVAALYAEAERHCDYSRLGVNPGGENAIVLFKSCFPNSQLGGTANDPPTTGSNPLRGQDCGSEFHTVANAKGIYNDILQYFAARQDKLFVLVTSPPLAAAETDPEAGANARALNNWLVHEWLTDYPHHNVAVFDFYNVLTSNGGNVNTNDLGQDTGNHHRWWQGDIQHSQTVPGNTSAYPTSTWDSHPSPAGSQKATAEFVGLLNIYYHCWQGTGSCPSAQLPLEAEFTADMTSGPVPLTVHFTDLSTGLITSHLWNFGDGGTATEQNPNHTYSIAGTYTVSLGISGPNGSDVEEKADYIQVTGTSWESTYLLLWEDLSTLDLLRLYRDQVLTRTPRGAFYVDRLYENADAVVEVLQADPDLLFRLRDLISANLAAITATINGSPEAKLTTASILAFLEEFSDAAPPRLKVLMRMARQEISANQKAGTPFLGFQW